MSGHDENLATTNRLDALTQLARSAYGPMTPLQRMEGLQIVTSRVGTRRTGRAKVLVLSMLGTAAAVGVVGGVMGLVRLAKHADLSDTNAIAYQVEGGEIGDGGYVRSLNPSGTVLRFEEGTELRLMTGARGRLTSVDTMGARLAIEEGEAEVKVTPRPGARWLVDAGPFLITVRGTVFTASWNGTTEQLDINMTKGLVSVTGPLADGVLAVRAGQHLTVNMQKREVLLRQIDGSRGSSDENHPSPTGTPAGSSPPGAPPSASWSREAPGSSTYPFLGGSSRAAPARAATGGAARSPSPTTPRSWSVALASGDLDSILRDAERTGMRRALADASSDDLAALADAARYRRRDDIAQRALVAQRDRFPGSPRAHDSAFLLGRLDEAQPGGGARALRWYDLYLKEAPSGAYSSEALGRKMTATERLRGTSAARAVAEEYLRRFPNGTYAGAARALRDAP